MTGNEAVVQAAIAAGADMFSGYPITPTTEILTGWSKAAKDNKNLVFFQAEDEPAAGFVMLGGVSMGRKAWTATAGVGNVLMQDPLVLAEAMRLPAVTYIGQRGGPSTGTVIYSQQELNLTRMGGNGEGLRIVFAPSNLQELYDMTIKAFFTAWKYRFPAFILSDGYIAKTYGEVNLWEPEKSDLAPGESYFLNPQKQPNNMRNCFSQEKELYNVLIRDFEDFCKMSEEVAGAEISGSENSRVLVCAWGAVANSAKTAISELEKEGKDIKLFRPLTMRPFPVKELQEASKGIEHILIAESSNGQFGRIIRETLYGITNARVHRLYRPAIGIMPEEIEAKMKEILK
ncbi:ferredoxin oxidoreductase [candidate division WS5 bacterium]|uniref:Ferredoxin oxidoreductase n=1 Tax=candidate division WS5 bacterium TaxID=2093353 RepID=A0A419DG98_9BACT|nr:MAG: ferredoxin oxidoreductase [candidate division WS5 bacterium]